MNLAAPQLLEAIGVLRREITNHPVLFVVLVAAVLEVVGRLRSDPERSARLGPRVAVLAAIASLVAYLAIVLWYVQIDQYADPAEPSIAAVAWLFDNGQPIYHDLQSAERYSHIYGPLAFIIPGWSLAIFGADIRTSKVAGALAGLASIATVFALTRRAGGRRPAMTVTALYATTCLMFQHVSFWIRPDSFQLLFSGLALYAAASAPQRIWSAVVVGVAAGALADLKLTAPLYALPAFAVLLAERRWRAALAAAALAAIVAAVPFVMFANVSFSNFLLWVRTSAGTGLQPALMAGNIEWGAFLLLPLALLPRAAWAGPTDRWLLGCTIAAVAAIAVIASKPGTGPYHLLPFAPAIAYGLARSAGRQGAAFAEAPRSRRLATAIGVSIGIIATLQTIAFVHAATRTHGQPVADDVRRIAARHPTARVAMGYSTENEAYPYVRPILVFQGGPYLFDAPAIQEFQLAGRELPAASIDAISTCGVDIWLIPKGGDPFSLRNRYPQTGHAPLFSADFRAAFHRGYAHTSSTDYFDLWTCRSMTSGAVRRQEQEGERR
jgi:hypothetical protein